MTPELGLIEGRFGRAWSWLDRTATMRTLAKVGYGFHHYGPKLDRHLRRTWREPHPPAEHAALLAFAAACRDERMRFGIALTPAGLAHPIDRAAREQLVRRVAELDTIGIDDLVILFDDLRGDVPGLAEAQADIVHLCAERTAATRVFCCPTYYSYDRVLDRAFGQRPDGYLARFGRLIDPAVRIYWTGEEVCSREISPGHLRKVAAEIGRPVCLWDNYPVNDGARMSRFLHLRSFTGRRAAIGAELAAHAINPAIQPTLTCLPALTLPALYREGDDYCYGAAFEEAARELFGDTLAAMIVADVPILQDVGLERLGDHAATLRARYAEIDHAAAREIVGWLDGHDLMTNDEVRTQ